MTASAICQVQDGAGPFLTPTNGLDVTQGNTVSITLASTTDVSVWTLQIFGVDEVTATAPTLSGVDPDTHQVTTPGTTVTFTVPAGAGIGRAFLIRSSVNGGGSSLTTTFGLYTLTSSGRRVGAVGERFEGNNLFGWASTVNSIIRAGGGGGGLPPLAGVQYAVLMEDPVGVLTFQQLTQNMIAPAFAIASFAKTAPSGSATLVRRGQLLSGLTAAATYTSGPPTSASIANTLGGSSDVGDNPPGPWTINAPYATASMSGAIRRIGSDLGLNPTWTFTLTATKNALSVQSGVTVTWTRDVYWGVGPAGFSTEADIVGLAGSTLQVGRNRIITVSPSNEKVYYAYPKADGLATFTLNNFPASFLAPVEVQVTNVNSVTSTYYLYESTNLLTGSNLNFVVT